MVSRTGPWFVVLCYMALDDNDDGIVVLKCIQPYSLELYFVLSCILHGLAAVNSAIVYFARF